MQPTQLCILVSNPPTELKGRQIITLLNKWPQSGHCSQTSCLKGHRKMPDLALYEGVAIEDYDPTGSGFEYRDPRINGAGANGAITR